MLLEISAEGEETNLFYQDTEKTYTSSSSGYSYTWGTDKTILVNSDNSMTKDAQKSSNEFQLELTAGKTYKLTAEYVGGEATKLDDGISIDFSIYNKTTSTKLVNVTVGSANNGSATFTAETSETITAEAQIYLYTGVQYTNLKYQIKLTEVL